LVHNFSDRENITFALLKVVPHVKDLWDTYSEQRAIEESAIFVVSPTWDSFQDAIKEQYYPVGSYEDQYTRWTTMRQEKDQIVPDFWVRLIDTLLGSSRNLRRRGESSDLQNSHRRSREKKGPNPHDKGQRKYGHF
jgi:hypothetical protein